MSRSVRAFGFGFPIGALGGLIGLGGAEFRLPVLVAFFGYRAKAAVAINLAVSFTTVVAAFVTRAAFLPVSDLSPFLPVIGALASASMVGAYIGSSYLHRINEPLLERVIVTLLIGIAALLVFEALHPFASVRLIADPIVNLVLAAVCGIGIGIVSSLLGVAGGELIIPTLMLVFGVEIKLAGSASLLISITTIAVGVTRYYRAGYYDNHDDLRAVVAPMGAGSILGAAGGGALVGVISSEALKLVLGAILLISAVKMFQAARRTAATPVP